MKGRGWDNINLFPSSALGLLFLEGELEPEPAREVAALKNRLIVVMSKNGIYTTRKGEEEKFGKESSLLPVPVASRCQSSCLTRTPETPFLHRGHSLACVPVVCWKCRSTHLVQNTECRQGIRRQFLLFS